MSSVVVGEILAILMFVGTLAVVLIGYPVAFSLAGLALMFAMLGMALDVFDLAILSALGNRYFGTMVNESLVAVPLFVFMGVMLERSKIAESLLLTMGELFGSIRGGLGYSVVIVGTLLAASTGIVGATVVTMGLLALPAMLRTGYDPKLATGTICAAGTLGQIIPPSMVLIFIGDILQGANQQAQLTMGNLSPDPISVGQLFAGAVIPGLVLVSLYLLWVFIKSIIDPASCPPLMDAGKPNPDLLKRVIVSFLPPIGLIAAVLGSILLGVATPTESASVGAVGACLLAASRRQFNLAILQGVLRSTLIISSLVFAILLGASVFSLVFRGLGGENLVHEALSSIPGGAGAAVLVVMAIIFALGFFLDTFEIIFIVVPIAAPVLIQMGVDPLWLGVAIGVNLQTSYLTPPFGMSLIYLRGIAPATITTGDIYRGAGPFVVLQVIGMAVLWFWPQMVTWLPEKIFRVAPMSAPIAGPARAPATSGVTPLFVDDNFSDLYGVRNERNRPPSDDFGDLYGPRRTQQPAMPQGDDFSDLYGPRNPNTPMTADDFEGLYPN
jgi:tripartite ATP-independent transporter DctM subunit